jgi:surface protein
MSNQPPVDTIEIIYKKIRDENIKIFGSALVENNKDKCKIIYEDKLYNLKEYFKFNSKGSKDIFSIGLFGINKISDAYVSGCTLLRSIKTLSKWDTSNVINMSGMFSFCSELESVPKFLKFNTLNVTDMSICFVDVNHYVYYQQCHLILLK